MRTSENAMERKFREFLYLSEVKGLHPRQIQQLLLVVYLEGTRQVLYGAVSGVEAQWRNDPYMLRNRRRRHGGRLGLSTRRPAKRASSSSSAADV
jgi:hypothetical protein